MKKYTLTIHGNKYDVTIGSIEDNVIEVEVNGSSYKVEVDKSIQSVKTPKLVRPATIASTDNTPSASSFEKFKDHGIGKVKSPLPGTVLKIHVAQGDRVNIGQKLITLEAMKMENSLDSDKEGKVLSINVKPGQSVTEGDVLMEIGE